MNHTQRLVAFVGPVVCVLGLATDESFAQADFFEGFNDTGSVPPGQQGPIGLIKSRWIWGVSRFSRHFSSMELE